MFFKRFLQAISIFVLSFVILGSFETKAAGKNIVVMIDPGHGGSNLGGQVPGLNEKDVTMVTALAMKAELEKYEGITVYLTRTADTDLSLAARAQAAAQVQADYLFCLHYNMSVPHNLYGAEVWIPSLGTGYAKGYALGDLILNELCDQNGLYRRGIKTKVKADGTDYYGVIRQSSLLSIPSVIIEHCHLDNPNDVPFYNSIENMQKLGRLDATAVAKYFHLKSSVLLVDYSGYAQTEVPAPAIPVIQDLTPPESVQIKVDSKQGSQINVTITASDLQSGILYYDYSSDGGITWSALQKWNPGSNSVKAAIQATAGKSITVRAYNSYDLCTQGNTVNY